MNHESSAIRRSEDDGFRSSVVRNLVQGEGDSRADDRSRSMVVPRTIIQFWHDPLDIPNDVQRCMESWHPLRDAGFKLLYFDDSSAQRFVADNLEPRHLKAFAGCYHPAMRSDYFRLCYIGLRGGCYVDADDVYNGRCLDVLFRDGRLKLHPLCYDVLSDTMVHRDVFTRSGADSTKWIFYFNNNPLIAPARDPVILRALERSTQLLTEAAAPGNLPEIQSTTGPGNLTASLVAQALVCDETRTSLALMVISNWDDFATSVWPLSYRADARNWRLSNRRRIVR
jgi:hypothetical protein